MRNRVKQFHELERARISRWFRESEHGWMMFAPDGRAVPLLRDEAETLEFTANLRLERFCRQLATLPFRLAAIICFGIFAHRLVDADALVLKWTGWLAVAICGAAALWEVTSEMRYRAAQTRWRTSIAKEYESRGTIEAGVAAHHRRYNLFRLASGAAALGAVSLTLREMASHPDVMAIPPAAIGLAVLAVLLSLPANKVDETHRRRKWL